MKKLVALLVLMVFMFVGCSSGVSPVVEFNAAMESYDREASALNDLRRAANNSTGEEKAKFLDGVARKEKILENLKRKAKEAESKL